MKMLGVDMIIFVKIIHVSQKYGYIDHIVQCQAGFFENGGKVFKHTPGLGLDVIAHQTLQIVNIKTYLFACLRIATSLTGDKEQIAHRQCVRVGAKRFG